MTPPSTRLSRSNSGLYFDRYDVFRINVTEAGLHEVYDDERRICYHDSVALITVIMVVPLQALIADNLLKQLFRPNGKFLYKRTAVFYQPLELGKAFKAAKKICGSTRQNSISATGQGDKLSKH